MASRDLWELRYDPRVRRELERIRSKDVLRKIEGAARQLRERPFSGKALRGHSGVRSLPITTAGGEYRLLYLPIVEDRVVLVILVAPREVVYKLLRQRGG